MENKIIEWVKGMEATEQIPEEIEALNFGIYETEDGFCLYLTGSENYDAEDDDWACDQDYETDSDNLAITNADGMEWEQFLDKVAGILKSYFSQISASSPFIGKIITTGFDDGDLVRVL